MNLPPLNPHQLKEVRDNAYLPKRGLWWSPRARKTRPVIESMALIRERLAPMLEQQKRELRGLIVTPLSVGPQWADLLEAYGFTVQRLYADQNRAQVLARIKKAKRTGSVLVVSWRRIASQTKDERRAGKCAMTEALLDFAPDCLVLDEAHEMAQVSSRQGRAARRLAWHTPWVRELTGTPSPNHYGNLWGQLVALDREEFGRSYEAFAQRYLVRDAMFPSRVLAHINTAELQAKILKYVSIVRRQDVFGPDQWVEDTKYIDLPPKARETYEKLAQAWLVDDPESAMRVDATHILKRLMRLQQVAAGYAPGDDGQVYELHTEKLDLVQEDIGNIVRAGEKAIVFHRFKWEGESLYKRALTLGVPVHRIHGEVNAGDRAKVLAAMEQSQAQIAIVQTKSGGVGISFAEVPYQLVVSRSFSLTAEEQAHDRTYKPNTQRFVTYYEARNTVDEFISSVQANKQNIHRAVMHADREVMAYGRIKHTSMTKRSKAS